MGFFKDMATISDDAASLYRRRFGTEPQTTVFAPGRVNLIGEHIDYNNGPVFPAAINLGITLCAGPSADSQTHAISAELGEGGPFSLPPELPANSSWSRYPAAAAWAIGAKSPLNIAVSSTLPAAGCGLSSSAALLLAAATAWNHVDRLGHTPTKLAQLCQLGENHYVGVNCGIMDQMASACGVEGHALLIDIPTLEITPVPVPEGISVAVLDTGVPRSLAESGYNERRAQCEEACRILDLPSLREANLPLLDLIFDPTVKRRARHVVTEIQRVWDFRDALAAGDADRIGSLMAASHASLRDDYEVSCPELDEIVSAAYAAPGCIGARMTGAGFGGAAVALVETEHVTRFLHSVEQYPAPGVKGVNRTFFACQASQGAHIVAMDRPKVNL